MSKQEYTVFADHLNGGTTFHDNSYCSDRVSLADLINEMVKHGHTPVAWAPELVRSFGGRLHSCELRPESIAAGRLIEKTPSGWVALGAEKQEHFCNRDVPEGFWDFPKPELRKVEPASVDLNAAMIARDGPKLIAIPKPRQLTVRVQSTAKPNPFPTTLRSPDCDSGPSDHLNASRHQMAGMSD